MNVACGGNSAGGGHSPTFPSPRKKSGADALLREEKGSAGCEAQAPGSTLLGQVALDDSSTIHQLLGRPLRHNKTLPPHLGTTGQDWRPLQ